MARDIHDTLAQGFSSIVLHSRGALARGDAETARRTLELIEQVASEHLDEARRLVATASHTSLGESSSAEADRAVRAVISRTGSGNTAELIRESLQVLMGSR